MQLSDYCVLTYSAEESVIGKRYPQIAGYFHFPKNSPTEVALPTGLELSSGSIQTDFLSFDSNASRNLLVVSGRAYSILSNYLPIGALVRPCKLSAPGRRPIMESSQYYCIYLPGVVDLAATEESICLDRSRFWITDVLGKREKEFFPKDSNEIHELAKVLVSDSENIKLISAIPLCLKKRFNSVDLIVTNYYNFQIYVSPQLMAIISGAGLTGLDFVDTNLLSFES